MGFSRLRWAFSLAATVTAALALGTASAQTAAPATPAVRAPMPAVGQRNGLQAFTATCANCHLPRVVGTRTRAPVGPRLENRRETEAQARDVIRNGHGTMRGIPAARLADSEIPLLIAHLRTIGAVR
ncbi:MAG: cytochrome c [Deltaproteobacteria bacterium]|nr:cytochrome c [Deltaproteobacteria bacterium]